ncbi:hypothetical protein PM082_006189 [Marasmius tenuissimus]|nr:hypothetical protein PM082_006189 [Marasmius tenuissimus]
MPRPTKDIKEDLKPIVEQFWRLSIPDTEGVELLKEFYNNNKENVRELIGRVLRTIEPDAVEQRKGRRFKRQIYHAAGVNDTWCMDQHDKFQKFGLRFHNVLDPFSRHNMWLKVWWTNKNPRLIAKFYLDAARADGDGHCAGMSRLVL